MLKFADVTVPVNNSKYEGFFDDGIMNHYLNHFKDSFMPSLLYYLEKNNLLKVVRDTDGSGDNVLFQINRSEILDFFNITKEDAANLMMHKGEGIDELAEWVYNIPEYANNDHEVYAIAEMFNLFLKGNDQFSLIVDNNDNPVLIDIIRIIKAHDSLLLQGDNAALWFFYLLNRQESEYYKEDSSSDDDIDIYPISWYQKFDVIFDATQSLYSFGSNSQPKELTRIILSQYGGGFIYNPFAGFGSYHSEMSRGRRHNVGSLLCSYENEDSLFDPNNSLDENYYADEIDEVVWAAGRLRLLAYNMDSPNYVLGDSVKGFNADVEWVISTPPFGLQLINEKGEKEYADHMTVRRGLDLVNEDGMFVCVVPMNFLVRRDTEDIRRKLIDERLLTTVVYLPENVFSNTIVKTAIIFAKKNSGKVKFVDATQMILDNKVRHNVLDVAAISNLIEHDSFPGRFGFVFGKRNQCDRLTSYIFDECIRFSDFDDIAAIGYNLEPSSYYSSYIEIPEGFGLETLKSLACKVVKGASKSRIPEVLKSDILHTRTGIPFINWDAICKTSESLDNQSCADIIVRINSSTIKSKSLIISTIGDLKPEIFIPSNEGSLILSPSAYAFSIDESKVNAEYLVSELKKDYIKDQLRYKSIGGPLTLIKLKDLNNLKILIPNGEESLKEQAAIALERKEAYFEQMGVELAELKDKRHDEFVRMLRQRKHRIQQVMNEFGPAFALLDKCRLKNGGVLNDSDIVASRTGETVDSYFAKLNKIITKVEDLVTNLVDKVHWEPSSMVNIDSFVDNIPQLHLSDKYDIQTHHQHDVEIYEEGETVDLNEDRFININEEDLAILFDNIIANAAKWGFTDLVRRDYRILIDVSDAILGSLTAVRICISNNGEPINPSVDRKRFFEWGYGSGTGIGTWQLKDIVEHYGGSIKLNEYPDEISGFQTEYEIVLPLANND